jgi:hypothetical protein
MLLLFHHGDLAVTEIGVPVVSLAFQGKSRSFDARAGRSGPSRSSWRYGRTDDPFAVRNGAVDMAQDHHVPPGLRLRAQRAVGGELEAVPKCAIEPVSPDIVLVDEGCHRSFPPIPPGLKAAAYLEFISRFIRPRITEAVFPELNNAPETAAPLPGEISRSS